MDEPGRPRFRKTPWEAGFPARDRRPPGGREGPNGGIVAASGAGDGRHGRLESQAGRRQRDRAHGPRRPADVARAGARGRRQPGHAPRLAEVGPARHDPGAQGGAGPHPAQGLVEAGPGPPRARVARIPPGGAAGGRRSLAGPCRRDSPARCRRRLRHPRVAPRRSAPGVRRRSLVAARARRARARDRPAPGLGHGAPGRAPRAAPRGLCAVPPRRHPDRPGRARGRPAGPRVLLALRLGPRGAPAPNRGLGRRGPGPPAGPRRRLRGVALRPRARDGRRAPRAGLGVTRPPVHRRCARPHPRRAGRLGGPQARQPARGRPPGGAPHPGPAAAGRIRLPASPSPRPAGSRPPSSTWTT